MKRKTIFYFIGIMILIIGSVLTFHIMKEKEPDETNKLTATILAKDKKTVTVQDDRNIIYTFNIKDIDADIGSNIIIHYTGLLDKNIEAQSGSVVDYQLSTSTTDENGIPTDWLDKGIFSQYYVLAKNKLETMSLDEKIAQILLVRYPDSNAAEILKKYQIGGYIFFEKDLKNKTREEVQNMIQKLQQVAKIPILTAVDEEGGTVVRVSSNPNLAKERFKSPKELYNAGGFSKIEQDTIEKSVLLHDLHLNLNLAPVVDVSTNSNDYMYNRTLGENTELTSTYAKTVIKASKGTKVSYTLKHFPGYGNNSDTHQGNAIDNRSLQEIQSNDLPPFKAGIEAGAEAILVSHNTVTSIDPNNPASLSPSIHNLLRNDLNFTGIIMTDDLAMGATSAIDNAIVRAILAGNDLIITTDYEEGINLIKKAIKDGTISEDLIDKLSFRVLAWKYYKGLINENQK